MFHTWCKNKCHIFIFLNWGEQFGTTSAEDQRFILSVKYTTKVLANFIVKLKSIKKLESSLGLYFHINFFIQTDSLKSHTFTSVLPKPVSPTCEAFIYSESDFSRNMSKRTKNSQWFMFMSNYASVHNTAVQEILLVVI